MDKHDWKHYIPATSMPGGNNSLHVGTNDFLNLLKPLFVSEEQTKLQF